MQSSFHGNDSGAVRVGVVERWRPISGSEEELDEARPTETALQMHLGQDSGDVGSCIRGTVGVFAAAGGSGHAMNAAGGDREVATMVVRLPAYWYGPTRRDTIEQTFLVSIKPCDENGVIPEVWSNIEEGAVEIEDRVLSVAANPIAGSADMD